MKSFYTMYVWLVAMIQNLFKSDLPAPTEEKQYKPLQLDLQFFADEGDDDDSDDDNDDSGDDDDADDDEPSLDELLKNPAFKKQYNQKLKDQLGKRMKKFDGVDPEEFKRLKAAAEKKDGKKSDEDDDPSKDVEQQKRLLRAERREKKAVVKEFAVDNGHNPKLLARLLDVDSIELDEDGEPENLDELFEELEAEFPEHFGAKNEADDEEEDDKSSKQKSGYVAGRMQKGNKQKKKDPKARGLELAQRIYGNKEEK
ncbi:hypothetical protein QOZ98_000508 [Planomicrobium stackebrandtii]|uniref:Scaffolding protein n=1 Tax=Planomicrobium stackebrandtii TaxID=253160 RepID=A0ABU0GQQ1_9BACL|nr:hypothetical protein [Planomicrobium stackebrandtii]MDQ0427683.1 hypothetical protein [Planomicrobium stackebrandtii]